MTHIGKYNYAETGYFYSGMFSLCIGIERVLKLIIIDDFRLRNNGKFPSNKELKQYIHRIKPLMDATIEIAQRHSLNIDYSIQDDELYKPIIKFLNDFADKARYYNLDTLTGQYQPGHEPLIRWDKEIASVIISRHYRPNEARQKEMEVVAELMKSFAMVQYVSDDGKRLDDPFPAVQESGKISAKQKYSKFYLYQIVKLACEIQRGLESKGNFFPYLREFFSIFNHPDRKYVLNKKSWNPLPPYRF